MKAIKIIGTSILLATGFNIFGEVQQVALSKVIKEAQMFKVVTNNLGKMTLVIGVITLIGGIVYCKYKKLNPEQVDKMAKNGSDNLLNFSQSQSLSSISTLTAKQTYQQLKCGISNQLMVDPVGLACSHQFSRKAIERWLLKSHSCPICRKLAVKSDLRRSLGTEKTIQRFKKKMLKKGKEWVAKRIEMDFETQNKVA